MTNIIDATFNGSTVTRTSPAYQYDYGQLLNFPDLNLPASFECHFSNTERGTSVTQIGSENTVTIPDAMFQSGAYIYAWVFLHAGEDDGETEYMAVIPILKRAKPTDTPPTPVQQDAITQAIAALNAAVEQTGHDVTDANEAKEAAQAAQQAIEDMTVSSTTLSAGSDATVTKTEQGGVVNLAFGIPQGDKGIPGDVANIASDYDSTKKYAVGEYCIYNNQLYRCTTAITTAEAWTAAHWTAAAIGNDVAGLKSDLDSSFNDIIGAYQVSGFTAGYINTKDSPVDITNIESPSGNYWHLVLDCVAGDKFTITGKTTAGKARVYAFIDSNGVIKENSEPNQNLVKKVLTAPADATKLVVNQFVGSDASQVKTVLFVGECATTVKSDIKDIQQATSGLSDYEYKSPNLLNPANAEPGYIALGGHIGGTTSGTYWHYNDYIAVSQGDKLNFNHSVRYVTAYDSSKAASSANGVENVTSYMVPSGVAFVRISVLAEYINDNMMANKGESLLPYVSYGTLVKYSRLYNAPNISKYENALGSTQKIVKEDSLSNDVLQITDFPVSLKNGVALSLYCEFSSFSTIYIGKGYDENYNVYFEINSSKIIKHTKGEGANPPEAQHDLTMSTFLMCNIYCELDKIHVNITTLDGSFSHEFDTDGNLRGNAYIQTAGTLSNITFTCECGELRKPLWLFGDSYLSMASTARVGYYLKQMGFTNFPVFAYPGMSPATGLSDLNKAKVFGTPKFIVWMLGMNGSDSAAISAINSLIDYATANGVTLILTKIPSVPDYRHATLNAFIEGSGYRFINSYEAMGCDGTGDTYDGYLSDDEVHPTALGANAIAMRALVDAPELMLYGRKDTN